MKRRNDDLLICPQKSRITALGRHRDVECRAESHALARLVERTTKRIER